MKTEWQNMLQTHTKNIILPHRFFIQTIIYNNSATLPIIINDHGLFGFNGWADAEVWMVAVATPTAKRNGVHINSKARSRID